MLTSKPPCVICGKGGYRPYEGGRDGLYVGMRRIRCVCGKAHWVCFSCWTDPICKVLADSFKGDVNLWTAKKASFDVCPESVKVAWGLME